MAGPRVGRRRPGRAVLGGRDLRGPVRDAHARLPRPQRPGGGPPADQDGAEHLQRPGGVAGDGVPGGLLGVRPVHGLRGRPLPADVPAGDRHRRLEPGDRRQRVRPQLRAARGGAGDPRDRRGELRRDRPDPAARPLPPAAPGPGHVGLLPGDADRQRPGDRPRRGDRRALRLAVRLLHRRGPRARRRPDRRVPARADPRRQRGGRRRGGPRRRPAPGLVGRLPRPDRQLVVHLRRLRDDRLHLRHRRPPDVDPDLPGRDPRDRPDEGDLAPRAPSRWSPP